MLRSTLLKLSESKGFANWVTSNGTTRRMARRFVAGETLDEAIAAARACNDAGMAASLDYLGENVSSTGDAQHSRDAYLEIYERIAQEKLNANVSCKLTQLGLDLKVISPTLFAMMVLMALATTLMTTPLVEWLTPRATLLSLMPPPALGVRLRAVPAQTRTPPRR